MTQHALIFGRGQIGIACAAALAGAGWQVRALARADLVGGAPFDRRDAASLAAALGAGADLVIDTIGFDAADAGLLLPFAGDIGQLVAISSAAVYADAEGRSLETAATTGYPRFAAAITEAGATVAAGPASYSTRKVAMEECLREGMRCPVAVLRPCAIHGIGSRHPREWWFVKRLLDGRAVIPLAFGGTSRFQTSAAAGIGALVTTLAARRLSGIFNIADPDAPSVADIGATIAAIMGRTVRFDLRPGPPVDHVGQTGWSLPRSFIVSTASALAAGYAPPGDYAATVRPTIDWLVATAGDGDWRDRFPVFRGYDFDPFDYAAEDAA